MLGKHRHSGFQRSSIFEEAFSVNQPATWSYGNVSHHNQLLWFYYPSTVNPLFCFGIVDTFLVLVNFWASITPFYLISFTFLLWVLAFCMALSPILTFLIKNIFSFLFLFHYSPAKFNISVQWLIAHLFLVCR